ncbi:uncharacterized protein LOC110841299 [Zootermopsis nevadensis]|uniref:uncharacterized protein LOC110841299 n=1 Tax=Zootermopsis nevadensis TaxID=136037 RepID=UPI000B8EDE4D|nr:uncharacterized protein LOC110841299 [Zootermopsis nevadensis]
MSVQARRHIAARSSLQRSSMKKTSNSAASVLRVCYRCPFENYGRKEGIPDGCHRLMRIQQGNLNNNLITYIQVEVARQMKNTSNANRTPVLVHRLLSKISDHGTRAELELFSLQLLHRKVQFTACGFFPLDFTLLYSGNRTADLVHKVMNVAQDVDVKKELELFSLQLVHRKVEFTACGFFPINFSLLYSIVGAVTTYLVILIQFHKLYDAETRSVTNVTSTV